MRALRVVGLTEDGEVVLEDPVRLERFRVPADERLRAAARGDLSRLGQIAIELESQLRPREIQARIRAGASVEQVAAAAGVPEQKIERFAYPVLLERFRTAEVAQRAHPVRAEGPDNRTLAEVVAHTFGLRGQAYEGARWDSWKGEDGRWVVALGWRAGRSDNRAHWTFQPGAHGGTVTALDEHASDLVEGLPARPLRTVGAVVDMTRPEEEPPPAPSPVEQWRAAASDSYRDPGRPAAERTTTRTAPEPWRPAPPAQRQAEPETRAASRTADTRPVVEPRDGGARPAAEWERNGTAARGTSTAPPARAERSGNEPARPPAGSQGETPKREPVVTEPAAPTAEVPVGTPSDAATVTREAPVGTAPKATEPVVEKPDVSPSAAARDTPDPAPEGDRQSAAATPSEAVQPEAAQPEPAAAPEAPSSPTGDAPSAGRRTKKGKPVMPSWDEVLLGVRGPR
jgi:hypothetical protein